MAGNSPKTLAGHRSVVTGASSGIGAQIARQLAHLGSDVVLVARRKDRLDALAAELKRDAGIRAEAIEADLCSADAPARIFEGATAGGPVTLLVNNAGIGQYAPFLATPFESHSRMLALNAAAVLELCHRFGRHMLAHGRPSYVCNIASIAAYSAAPNFAAYSGSKHLVRVFSETLRHELKGTNVSVTCVCPGGTATEFSEKNGQLVKTKSETVMMSAEKVARIAIGGLLAKRGIVIPGLMNWLACFLPRFAPGSLSIAAAGMAMRQTVEMIEKNEPRA